jgi:hypothetical protein
MEPATRLRCKPARRLVVATGAIAWLWLGACGEGHGGHARSSRSGTASRTVVQTTPLDADRDDDNRTGSHYDGDEEAFIYYGHEAGPGDNTAVRALLKRYFALAAAADGKRACSLIYPLEAESIVEKTEESGGSSASRGLSCASVVSDEFRRRHRELAVKSATMHVVSVRVGGDLGTAALSFSGEPESYLLLRREGVWKLASLVDETIP